MTNAPCPLCIPVSETLLWRDASSRVIWVGDADYPGFCRVILNAHVKEMSDLPPPERQVLMAVVFAVEAALREEAHPDKINLACLGNVVPHVHWHVIPRWADDPNFPDAIWAPARRARPRRDLPGDLQARVAARLAASL